MRSTDHIAVTVGTVKKLLQNIEDFKALTIDEFKTINDNLGGHGEEMQELHMKIDLLQKQLDNITIKLQSLISSFTNSSD